MNLEEIRAVCPSVREDSDLAAEGELIEELFPQDCCNVILSIQRAEGVTKKAMGVYDCYGQLFQRLGEKAIYDLVLDAAEVWGRVSANSGVNRKAPLCDN